LNNVVGDIGVIIGGLLAYIRYIIRKNAAKSGTCKYRPLYNST
jgi:hypothetical protein